MTAGFELPEAGAGLRAEGSSDRPRGSPNRRSALGRSLRTARESFPLPAAPPPPLRCAGHRRCRRRGIPAPLRRSAFADAGLSPVEDPVLQHLRGFEIDADRTEQPAQQLVLVGVEVDLAGLVLDAEAQLVSSEGAEG
jgi:hypothetical protein